MGYKNKKIATIMKYLSSINLLIMEGFLPLKQETIPSFYAESKFVCLFSNSYLFDYLLTSDVK